MKKLLFLLVCLFILSSCEKVEIEIFPMSQELSCIQPEKEIDSFIITSAAKYQELLLYKSDSSECSTFELPDIDFTKYMLIAKYTEGTGCKVNFHRTYHQDAFLEQSRYVINVTTEGDCELLGMNWNWMKVPVIPANYEMKFVVN